MSLSFRRPGRGGHTEFDCKETDSQIIWHVEQRSLSGRMVTDITCEKKYMLLVNYETQDGVKRHNRLWNEDTLLF